MTRQKRHEMDETGGSPGADNEPNLQLLLDLLGGGELLRLDIGGLDDSCRRHFLLYGRRDGWLLGQKIGLRFSFTLLALKVSTVGFTGDQGSSWHWGPREGLGPPNLFDWAQLAQ